VLEVGCGVGNTVFPLLAHCKRSGITDVFVYCCDYSSTAIELVRAHAEYDTSMCHAFVWDITDASASIPVQAGTIDAVSMIFVLSAIAPEHHRTAIANVSQLMRERTGVILFRDYGLHDLTQLRAKAGRCLRGTDALYARGDSTLVYYFNQDEVRHMFAHMTELQNWVDRRLIVNRAKKQKMYRIWLQAKYINVVPPIVRE